MSLYNTINNERGNAMLNQPIKTIDDGRKFIQFLDKNGLMFHLDDDVDNIIWCKEVDKKTIKLIGKRHKELWNIGNPWEYAEEIIDIILQLIELDKPANNNKEEEDIDPQPSLLDVKAYPTLNALFGRYDDDDEKI